MVENAPASNPVSIVLAENKGPDVRRTTKEDVTMEYPSLELTIEETPTGNREEEEEEEEEEVEERPEVIEEELSEWELKRLRRNRYIRYALGFFLLAFVVYVIVDSTTSHHIKTGIDDFLHWVELHPGKGVLAFSLVIFCTTMLFIPGIILTFGSGYVFANAFGLGVGVLLGSISVFLGTVVGAICSFLMGRFLFRDCVSGLTKKFKFFEALDKAMEQKGFRIMLLLRLSPIIYASPYVNYGVGGMAISFRDYVISLMAIIPATIMFVFLGSSAGSLAGSSGGKSTTIVLAVGIVVSVFGFGMTTYYTRQELRKVTEAAENEATGTEESVDEEMGQHPSGGNRGNEPHEEVDTIRNEDVENGTGAPLL